MKKTMTRFLLPVFLTMAATCAAQADPPTTPSVVNPSQQSGSFAPALQGPAQKLAHHSPLDFLKYCLNHYENADVNGYTCTFTKQERVKTRLTDVQVIAVRLREKPFSVDMTWIANAKEADRAMYIEGAWNDDDGQPLAWIKPHGWIIRIVLPKTKQPIHGKRAKAAARRTIDQFGFRRSLELILKYTELGRKNGDLKIICTGQGKVNGRPTFVFDRVLPYSGDDSQYPDGLLRFHIDQEWLVPTAVFSYADLHAQKLLGSYILTDVTFNPVLKNHHFDPKSEDF